MPPGGGGIIKVSTLRLLSHDGMVKSEVMGTFPTPSTASTSCYASWAIQIKNCACATRPVHAALIQSPPPAPLTLPLRSRAARSSQSDSRPPPPLGCIVQRALNNRWLKEQGVPELRLPSRDSGIPIAKPNRRADEGGNYLDQAASWNSDESQSSMI
jgi:hypothetical protein